MRGDRERRGWCLDRREERREQRRRGGGRREKRREGGRHEGEGWDLRGESIFEKKGRVFIWKKWKF